MTTPRGRPRKYASPAERQRQYRERQRLEQEAQRTALETLEQKLKNGPSEVWLVFSDPSLTRPPVLEGFCTSLAEAQRYAEQRLRSSFDRQAKLAAQRGRPMPSYRPPEWQPDNPERPGQYRAQDWLLKRCWRL